MGQAKNLHNGLRGRKKYKCPRCNQYTIHIGREKLKCENKCIISPADVERIIKINDYNGYYLTEDLENKFGYDYRYKLGVDKQSSKVSLYSYKEIESMDKISHRTITINNFLDDRSIDYYTRFPERDTDLKELDQYDYLFNLVEDVTVSLNRMSKDLMLMDIAFQSSKYGIQLMFSVSYFYFNLSQHFYESMERILICLGILFKIPFCEDSKKNNRTYILKELKRSENYKKSEIREYIQKIMSNNAYGELINYRESSTHDVSSHIKFMQNNTSDADKAEVEKEMVKPIIKNFLEVLNTQYDLIEKIISNLNLFYKDELDSNAINMIKGTHELPAFNINLKYKLYDICAEQHVKNIKRLYKIRVKSKNDPVILIYDVIFRIFEIIKGCNYAIEFGSNDFIGIWQNEGIDFVLDSMDRQYLIYSSSIRIYSCYDKIAKYLSNIYKLSDYKEIYFDKFVENAMVDDDLIKFCRGILNDPFYLLLSKYRNDIVHIIRTGCLYINAMDDYEDYLLVATVKNICNIGKIIDKIL